VSVNQGVMKIDKVVCAIDCGKVINPDLVTGQIEGGVVWALTAIRFGGVELKHGRVQASNFHDKPVTRLPDCPPISVHFVTEPGELPWGVGELSSPPTVPAVLNALFAATGKRIRQIPVNL
jgi:isoquinoline 1-oxidoreductase subunit beta